MDEARKLLVETKVKALGALHGSSLIQLLDTNTVGQALQVLADNRILSAPVLAPGDGGLEGRWPAQLPDSDIMGFICVNDILTSFLECYAAEYGETSLSEAAVDTGVVHVHVHHPHTPYHQALSSGACGCGGDWAGDNGGVVSGGGVGGVPLLPPSSSSSSSCSMLGRMRQLEALGLRFAQQQLRDLSCKGCDGDFLHSRHAGEATLLELVMYGFLDPKRRGMHEGEQQAQVVHRVALFDSRGAVTGVISQSDLCRFLEGQLHRLGQLAQATVEDLGWDCKPVVSCTPDTPALHAMRLMVARGVSAVAVVAAAPPAAAAGGPDCPGAAEPGGQQPGGGRLLGNFSASEMRTMTAEHFGALSLPVGEFLALEHETEFVAANRQRMLEEEGVAGSPAHDFIRNRLRRIRPHTPGEEVGQRLVVASPQSTFAEVLGLLVQHRIHRLYVVDSREVPLGVVTCTDILRKVVEAATLPLSPASTLTAAAAGNRALRPTASSSSGGPPRTPQEARRAAVAVPAGPSAPAVAELY